LETFEFVLILAATVLASSFISRLLPKVSYPLVQIALGLVIALFMTVPVNISLDPEFFMVLFIAPLLFNDAKHVDKVGLWKNRGKIALLAIGLVIAITFAVGFIIHALIPSISLPAAFALGAALGPTDAVAVASLKAAAKLDPKESSMLSGEALINDATGVVSFSFAITAAVTGEFSVFDATLEFLIEFFGGIIIGIILAGIIYFIQKKLHESGLDTITSHVLFDVLTPFFVYLIANNIGVSGILAVVAAGIVLSLSTEKMIGPSSAKQSIVSSSVWSVLTFVLNGIVFVMLGMQLPKAMFGEFAATDFDNVTLLIYILILSAVVILVRFIWIAVMERVSNRKSIRNGTMGMGKLMKSTGILTVGGPKGAITLSVMFSIPYYLNSGAAFPERDLLIFMASGVILVTLLLANFLLPVLAPVPKNEAAENTVDSEDKIAEAKIKICNNVIEKLLKIRDEENHRAVRTVVRGYNDRINRIRTESDIDSDDMIRLRLLVLEAQQNALLKAKVEGRYDDVDISRNMIRIARYRGYLTHKNKIVGMLALVLGHLPTMIKVMFNSLGRFFCRLVGKKQKRRSGGARSLCVQASIEFLDDLLLDEDSTFPKEMVKEVLMPYLSSAYGLNTTQMNTTVYARTSQKTLEIERMAYHMELDEIDDMQDSEEITRSTAKRLRDNVYLMLVDLES
jgi:Na+/H+ antiporter